MKKNARSVADSRLDILQPPAEAPVPLVLYPPPSITRALAIDALEKEGRAWRVAALAEV